MGIDLALLVKILNCMWEGKLKLGMTSLIPSHACSQTLEGSTSRGGYVLLPETSLEGGKQGSEVKHTIYTTILRISWSSEGFCFSKTSQRHSTIKHRAGLGNAKAFYCTNKHMADLRKAKAWSGLAIIIHQPHHLWTPGNGCTPTWPRKLGNWNDAAKRNARNYENECVPSL